MAFGLIVVAAVAAISALVGISFIPRCDESQISLNIAGLRRDLDKKLHGQHIVQEALVKHIKGHFENPTKALSLIFHGPTGVGKNYVSGIVAKNLYKDGMESPFVHFLSAPRDFPHASQALLYKDQLKAWIEGNITKCGQSMFIFDEVDVAPPHILDVLKPYLDYNQQVGGLSFQKAIFIFLSNEGQSEITKRTFAHWKEGKDRENLKLVEFENDLMQTMFHSDNHHGLWHSKLLSSQLITAFIPFLPLEKRHVRACIKDDIVKKYKRYFPIRDAVPRKYVDEVLQELHFMPDVGRVYSRTGCKRVAEKVDFIMEDRRFDGDDL